MTTIQADIRDSLGNPVSGFIRITLDYWLADNQQSYLTVPAQVALTNGVATFDLEPSEQARVTYHFEVFLQGTPPTLVESFRSTVPDSPTPILFNSLARQTGITRDTQSSAIGAVSRRLAADGNFWNALRTNLFAQKGSYSPVAWYKAGDVVTWDGSVYVCVAVVAFQGIDPTDATRWQLWAARGATGTGTGGSATLYDAVSWNGATDAPSRNAIRHLVVNQLPGILGIAGKADVANAVLTAPRLATNPPLVDNSDRVVSSSWVSGRVQALENAVTPVGTVVWFAGSAAPSRWLLCDGRSLSRSTFPDLFNVLGTTYGSLSGTTFSLPDLRGRTPFAPDTSPLTGAANRATAVALATGGGASEVVLTMAQLPASGVNVNIGAGGSGTAANFTGYTGNTAAAGTNTAPLGAGQAHPNMPPFLGLNAIIYTGV